MSIYITEAVREWKRTLILGLRKGKIEVKVLEEKTRRKQYKHLRRKRVPVNE